MLFKFNAVSETRPLERAGAGDGDGAGVQPIPGGIAVVVDTDGVAAAVDPVADGVHRVLRVRAQPHRFRVVEWAVENPGNTPHTKIGGEHGIQLKKYGMQKK